MGILHRPQLTTIPVFAPIAYYFNRPQSVFGPGSGGIPPAGDDELIEEDPGTFDHLKYDSGVEDGFVLIEET